jgi:hypothetical protein
MEHTFHYLVFTYTEQYGDIYYKADVDLVISERDKVIEQQENLIATLKKERDWLAKDRAQAYDDLEKRTQLNIKQEEALRHHKYKRCLAMALWCDSEANYWYDSSKVQQCWRYGHYIRWFNKWSKLADQFTNKEE